MNEREIERRKRYEERMQKLFEQMLENNNIELIEDRGHRIFLKYKEKEFQLIVNEDWDSWKKTLSSNYDGRTKNISNKM